MYRNAHSANPIQEEIVESLSKKYGVYAMFFWSELEGDRIGVTWKPVCFTTDTKFSVLQSQYHTIIPSTVENGENFVVLNTIELISEMVAHANGVIEDVEVF